VVDAGRLGALTTMPRRITLRSDAHEEIVDVLDDERVSQDGIVRRLSWEGPGVARVDGERVWVVAAGQARWVYLDGCVHVFEIEDGDAPRRKRPHAGSLAAPMPATVRQIRVKAGDVVHRGDTLIVLEAMKMELPVRASADGIVSAIRCREGELVQPGVPLIEIAGADA